MKISNELGDLIISYNPIKLEEWEEYCIEIYDKFEKLGYKILNKLLVVIIKKENLYGVYYNK